MQVSESTSASNLGRICGKCGNKVFADAPQGFCGVCLFKTGLGSLLDEEDDAFKANGLPEDLQFEDYELLQEIGRGGQGVVYRARQKSLNRTVALKVIGVGRWATEAHLKRFRFEAEAAAGLNHPLIVPIHEIRERGGYCYFSMNLIEGGQLDEVAQKQSIPIRHAAELVAKLARTVHYAHEHGILHRDIKPGNVLLDVQGEPHLTDFGLARLVESDSTVTRTTDCLGTPSYMAPEQTRGNKQVTRATDIYGLGAVLYQLLTGRPPFVGATSYEIVRLLLETDARAPWLLNPKVDRDLSTICLKCLEKDPPRRYASALALAEDLERWLRHEPIRARRSGLVSRGRKWLQRNPTSAVAGTSLVGLITVLAVILWKDDFVHPPATGIAVLPFQSLGDDKENAVFADGIQDDILTKLAKVADLKVISRTSVMGYRGNQNMRQIGAALRVSHVLEGSVRKNGSKIHLNAQLIDSRTDRHVWAEEYDRDVSDVFNIQSEIAKAVADQLQAKLSPAEKNAIEQRPTSDLTAFDQYSRAKTLILVSSTGSSAPRNLIQAIELLNSAVARDSSFHAAFCELVNVHDVLYSLYGDHTASRLAAAEAALKRATELQPHAAETHLVRGSHLYSAFRDYDRALTELEAARAGLPNDPRILEYTGYILRRQGRPKEGLRSLEQAVSLDPRNPDMLGQLAVSYLHLRRFAEEKATLQRVLEITPDDVGVADNLLFIDLAWRGDTAPLHQWIDRLRAERPAVVTDAADVWFVCALAERDWTGAEQALAASGNGWCWANNAVILSRQFGEGLLARAMHDEARAHNAFATARLEQEQIVQKQKNYGPPLCVLGLIDAALGDKEAALREGRRAMELMPVEKDSINGQTLMAYFAVIAAWAGEKDLALQQLVTVAPAPGATLITSYGVLKLLPFWEPLRGDPRFEAIVASLAPKQPAD
jgi:TolB-like protein/Tfp pilus assembly protein PilF/tRNA A-37 threonylcarbamoyl transferase component Bud32